MALTDEEALKLSDAIGVLQRHFGGEKWEIEKSPTSFFDPADFKLFNNVRVNGSVVRLPVEVDR